MDKFLIDTNLVTTTGELLTMLNECQNCDSGPTSTAPRNSKRGSQTRARYTRGTFCSFGLVAFLAAKYKGIPKDVGILFRWGSDFVPAYTLPRGTVCMPMKCSLGFDNPWNQCFRR